MNNIYDDFEYMSLIEDIINNDSFNKIRYSVHHGLSRLDHSLRVSYYSYVIAKKLGYNYVEVARAGLLHDFFTNEELSDKERKVYAFIHHKKALNNASKYYKLSKLEKNIIISHMFPLILFHLPRFKESWLVSAVDKMVALYEYKLTKSVAIKRKCYNMASYMILFMMFCSRFNIL